MSRVTVLIELELGLQCSRQTISVLFLDPISPPSLPEGLSLSFLTLLNPTGLLCLHGDTMINPCPSILRTARHNVGVSMHVLPDWFMLMYSNVVPCFILQCFYAICLLKPCKTLKRMFKAKYGLWFEDSYSFSSRVAKTLNCKRKEVGSKEKRRKHWRNGVDRSFLCSNVNFTFKMRLLPVMSVFICIPPKLQHIYFFGGLFVQQNTIHFKLRSIKCPYLSWK